MNRAASDPAMSHPVPGPIVLYALMGLADFGLTLAALVAGIEEANPLLAWFESQGLFEFGKLSLTLLVCCIAFKLWQQKIVRRVMVAANLVMLAVLVYHIVHFATALSDGHVHDSVAATGLFDTRTR